MTNNNPQRYGRAAIAFHWTIALLVVWVGVLGLLHDSWPKPVHVFWINVHALSGLALWILVLARYYWRITHDPPSLPADIGAPDRHLSRADFVRRDGLLARMWPAAAQPRSAGRGDS